MSQIQMTTVRKDIAEAILDLAVSYYVAKATALCGDREFTNMVAAMRWRGRQQSLKNQCNQKAHDLVSGYSHPCAYPKALWG